MIITDTLCSLGGMMKQAPDTAHNLVETVAGYMEEGASDPSNSLEYFLHPDLSAFGNLAVGAIVVGIILPFLLIAFRAFAKHASKRFRDISLQWCFIVVWFYGFVVYDVGMCTGQYISLLTNAPMAILYAFKIFIFDSDVSEIHEVFHNNWFYSLNFALVHFLAAVISTLFLIKYFGFNILARLKMKLASGRFASTVSETFVFWGFNEESVHLIESIKKEFADSDDYRIVLVRTGKDNNETPEERTGLARIFDFLAMPTSELERLQTLGCLTVSSYSNLSDLNAGSSDEDIIGSALKLKSLKKLLLRHTACKIHLLFLSDDEKENLHNVALLLNDTTIKQFVKEPCGKVCKPVSESENGTRKMREVVLYCLARYNSIHRVIEDQQQSAGIKVKVVDSSHINVERLKLRPELLPVNYVDVEADATVSSDFNALVVGFSEVGLDSVRFLYEFGAFVRTGSTDDDARRSGFHLDVVDKNMDDLAGTFVANAPAIRPSMPFVNGGRNTGSLITLHKMDCRSVEFYQKLTAEWIQRLNYVVIATENDELNLSLGVRIFKASTRYRKSLDKLCILIRAHNDDDGHIRRIAGHYNRLWAAYLHAHEENGKRIHQDTILKGQSVEGPIHIFGLDSKTFTYKYIIADELEQKARKYACRYIETVTPDKQNPESALDESYNDIMQLSGKWKGYSPTYFGITSLRRTRTQDMANSLHELTKKTLAETALEICRLKNFVFSKITRKPNTTRYIWPHGVDEIHEINRIAITLAQTEHLRWNASHEILGYVCDDTKDEVRMRHNCLTDWHNLPEDVRSYDCNVADFILGIPIAQCSE